MSALTQSSVEGSGRGRIPAWPNLVGERRAIRVGHTGSLGSSAPADRRADAGRDALDVDGDADLMTASGHGGRSQRSEEREGRESTRHESVLPPHRQEARPAPSDRDRLIADGDRAHADLNRARVDQAGDPICARPISRSQREHREGSGRSPARLTMMM